MPTVRASVHNVTILDANRHASPGSYRLTVCSGKVGRPSTRTFVIVVESAAYNVLRACDQGIDNLCCRSTLRGCIIDAGEGFFADDTAVITSITGLTLSPLDGSRPA